MNNKQKNQLKKILMKDHLKMSEMMDAKLLHFLHTRFNIKLSAAAKLKIKELLDADAKRNIDCVAWPCPKPGTGCLIISSPASYEGFQDFYTKAKTIPDADSAFYKTTSESNEREEEINVSAVVGQLFSTAYPPAVVDRFFRNYTCGNLTKEFSLPGFPVNTPLMLNVDVLAKLPEIGKDYVYQIELGDAIQELAGVLGYLTGYVTFTHADGSYTYQHFCPKEFLNVVKTRIHGTHELYHHEVHLCKKFTMPAGTVEFAVTVTANVKAYCDTDFRNVAQLDPEKVGFALLDLRQKGNGNAHPIMSLFENKVAPGGVKLSISTSICPVDDRS